MATHTQTIMQKINERYFDTSSPHLDAFGRVLFLTLLSLVYLLLFDLNANGEARYSFSYTAVIITVGLTLIATLRAAGVAKRPRRIITTVISIGLIGTLIATLIDAVWPDKFVLIGPAGFNMFWIITAVLCPIVASHRLLLHKKVTINTLYAAISSYLQIALAFALIYITIGASNFTGAITNTASFAYFSLTTISTLGFGDIAAISQSARALTVAEALIGQIYLVVLVAMIVGSYVSTKSKQ